MSVSSSRMRTLQLPRGSSAAAAAAAAASLRMGSTTARAPLSRRAGAGGGMTASSPPSRAPTAGLSWTRWDSSLSSSAPSAAATEGPARRVPEPRQRPAKDPWVPEFAFAFDIDGVLLHKSQPIKGARETLQYLQKHKIPFILLTNGGGKSEQDRVDELSKKLGVDLDVSNFVQSHTPYQLLANSDPDGRRKLRFTDLAPYLNKVMGIDDVRESTILVLGSDASAARRIAQGYGFKSVVTPGDILQAHPEIFPFNPLSEFYSKQDILPLPKPIFSPTRPNVLLKDCLKIDAVLVFNDPRDWAVDIQLIIDLALSHRGYLGTYSRNNNNPDLDRKWQYDRQPPIVYSNCDLLWSTGYHLPRFGQGAFRNAVRAQMAAIVHKDQGVKGYEMRDWTFGKPHLATYAYAQSVLKDHYKSIWGLGATGEKAASAETGQADDLKVEGDGSKDDDAAAAAGPQHVFRPKLRSVYMVGDNPESDIRGARAWAGKLEVLRRVRSQADRPMVRFASPRWRSLLVKTGVWDQEQTPLSTLPSEARPDRMVHDVRNAVNHALKAEGWPGRLL